MTARTAAARGPRGVGEAAQRLAYACAEAVAARLGPGVTEREAARTRRDWLRARGVRVRRGYADRHRAHPFGVVAHKVGRVRERRWSPTLFGFGTQALKGLASDAPHGHREGWSPLWSPHGFSDHPPQSGVWASSRASGSGVRERSSRSRWW